ncbi:MAG: LPS export ABC transporter periplasmic protein LptC [Thermaurantimonas sp.]
MNKIKQIFGTAVRAAVLFLFAQCTNNPELVRQINQIDTLPVEQRENIHLVYTDSGFKRFEMKAPIAAFYNDLQSPKLEFQKGIHVWFYDFSGSIESELSAGYAIRYPASSRWEAMQNVIFVSKKGEKLETDHLIWDETAEKIFSDKKVTVTTGKEIIVGEGFEADQYFNSYKIQKITGEILLEDED